VTAVTGFHHPSLYEFTATEPSYWEATAGPRHFSAPRLEVAEQADVAIIGGGYTGLSAALHLARDFGVDVRVLEAGPIGWGASGRNGGFCSIGGVKMSLKRQLRLFGRDETRRYYQSQAEAIELVRSLGQDEAIDFQAQGDGEVTVAATPAHYRALVEQAEAHRSLLGLDSEILSRDAFLEQGYDSPEQHGALKLRPTFGLHPLRYVLGLAAAAERRGARLHGHSEVVSWEKADGRHLLRTAAGSLAARHVIVACNGYMPEGLVPRLAGRVMPVQSNIIVTRPLTPEEQAAQRWRNDCPTIDSRHLFFYYRLLPDGRLMLGGRGALSGHPRAADRIYRWMERRLGEIWPHWRGIEISHRWRGLVCLNWEGRPAIGKFPDDPSVLFGFGYHGNGVNTATWTGRALAEWLAGSNASDSVVPAHLPAAVRGPVKPFPVPGLRKLTLQAAISLNRLRDLVSN